MTTDKGRRWMCASVAGAALMLMVFATGATAQAPEQKATENYQTFYLKNATGHAAANDIQTTLRNMLPAAKIYYAATENSLSVKGSAEDIALAQKMLNDIDRPERTYRVSYTISAGGGGQGEAQHLALIVTPGGKTISKQGSRVPIMTGSFKDGDSANSQFQYVDVGLSVESSIAGYDAGLQLHSKIEETSVADEKSNVGIQDPVVKQSVLEVQSGVTLGKPLTLGSVETPDGKRMQVQAVVEVAQ